ncbi:hypothetical protein HMPREF3187_01691 [Aerococcus christensenii]|uniref:Uncharacterized protein n=1 Tax=Aerococcus christensenii TaxID=87541 RepID=A0A133XR41_9LACT|nr:hypothetical protein HMPREF3187_01691 [Aerococcus christensenii]
MNNNYVCRRQEEHLYALFLGSICLWVGIYLLQMYRAFCLEDFVDVDDKRIIIKKEREQGVLFYLGYL